MKIKRKFKSVTYRVDQDTYDRIQILSKDDRRSATSLIELLVDREFKKRYPNVKSNPSGAHSSLQAGLLLPAS